MRSSVIYLTHIHTYSRSDTRKVPKRQETLRRLCYNDTNGSLLVIQDYILKRLKEYLSELLESKTRELFKQCQQRQDRPKLSVSLDAAKVPPPTHEEAIGAAIRKRNPSPRDQM